MCTSADYYPVYGACEDGVAIKSYLPNSYPNRCHSGEVPAPEEVPCDDSSVVCELGLLFRTFLFSKCIEMSLTCFSTKLFLFCFSFPFSCRNLPPLET